MVTLTQEEKKILILDHLARKEKELMAHLNKDNNFYIGLAVLITIFLALLYGFYVLLGGGILWIN